jgi:hypothetical protein
MKKLILTGILLLTLGAAGVSAQSKQKSTVLKISN